VGGDGWFAQGFNQMAKQATLDWQTVVTSSSTCQEPVVFDASQSSLERVISSKIIQGVEKAEFKR
jgi:hypothetical protein